MQQMLVAWTSSRILFKDQLETKTYPGEFYTAYHTKDLHNVGLPQLVVRSTCCYLLEYIFGILFYNQQDYYYDLEYLGIELEILLRELLRYICAFIEFGCLHCSWSLDMFLVFGFAPPPLCAVRWTKRNRTFEVSNIKFYMELFGEMHAWLRRLSGLTCSLFSIA